MSDIELTDGVGDALTICNGLVLTCLARASPRRRSVR